MSLYKRVDAIPVDGFWKQSSRDTFHDAAKQLKDKGFTDDQVVDLLQDLWNAVGTEYGS